MTIKHTLGPWKAPASQFGYVTAIDNYGNPITVCTTRTQADARLIAAAPELLDALQEVADDEIAMQGFHEQFRAKIRKVIAKAKGKA
jgi:hypothetical protein